MWIFFFVLRIKKKSPCPSSFCFSFVFLLLFFFFSFLKVVVLVVVVVVVVVVVMAVEMIRVMEWSVDERVYVARCLAIYTRHKEVFFCFFLNKCGRTHFSQHHPTKHHETFTVCTQPISTSWQQSEVKNIPTLLFFVLKTSVSILAVTL